MTDRADGQWRWPLPDDWEPTGYWCVQITIPGDQQYFDRLTGALGLLTLSKSWFPDATRQGPKAVAAAWEAALYLNPFNVTESCPVVPAPPIPNQAAADDAAAAIITVFLQHIVSELNACAAVPGDCGGCVDTLMTELTPYGATDAVRGTLNQLCADLNDIPGTRAQYETDCPYVDQYNDLRGKIADNPYDWLNHLSDWMFNWLNQTADRIFHDLNTLAGLMGFGAQGYINDHGGIPGGGGASFGGDCAWAVDLDFTATDGGFHALTINGVVAGVWSAGVGWQHTYDAGGDVNRLYIEYTASVHYTSILVTYSITTGDAGAGLDIREWDGAGGGSNVIASGQDNLTPNTPYTGIQFGIGLVAGGENLWLDQNLMQSMTITAAHIEGIGFNPWA